MKTEGHVQEVMHKLATPLTLFMLLIIAVISLWTPLAHPQIAARWFTLPNVLWFLPVPLLVLIASWVLLRSVRRGGHYAPFLLTLLLVFLGYIPPSITLWQAAAPPQSLGFMLVGALFIIPIILVYTFWSYYVFRGKINHDQGYH
jgi:cytochrome d ubiquinol oxidase subunit II